MMRYFMLDFLTVLLQTRNFENATKIRKITLMDVTFQMMAEVTMQTIKECFIIFIKCFVAFQPQFIRHFSMKLPSFYSQFCLTLKLSILKFQINNTPEASQKQKMKSHWSFFLLNYLTSTYMQQIVSNSSIPNCFPP